MESTLKTADNDRIRELLNSDDRHAVLNGRLMRMIQLGFSKWQTDCLRDKDDPDDIVRAVVDVACSLYLSVLATHYEKGLFTNDAGLSVVVRLNQVMMEAVRLHIASSEETDR